MTNREVFRELVYKTLISYSVPNLAENREVIFPYNIPADIKEEDIDKWASEIQDELKTFFEASK